MVAHILYIKLYWEKYSWLYPAIPVHKYCWTEGCLIACSTETKSIRIHRHVLINNQYIRLDQVNKVILLYLGRCPQLPRTVIYWKLVTSAGTAWVGRCRYDVGSLHQDVHITGCDYWSVFPVLSIGTMRSMVLGRYGQYPTTLTLYRQLEKN